MPVTIQVAPHQAREVVVPKLDKQAVYGSDIPGADTPSSQFLGTVYRNKKAGRQLNSKLGVILQQSMNDEVARQVVPRNNGLVHACLEAYNHHHHLTLRPDDIWIAIITQFSFYVNRHAETMRTFFVDHEGKKELIIKSRKLDADFIDMTWQMADLIQENVVDRDLQQWIIPAFSTTTEIDTLVCSAVMMGTMKEYFHYTFVLSCGIPSVTLEGDKSDWDLILRRLSKLASFGPDHPQVEEWRMLLTPVIQNMVDCFQTSERPTEATAEFWSKMALYKSFGSGSSHLSGWITAFCPFSADGEWQGSKRQGSSLVLGQGKGGEAGSATHVTYPTIDSDDIPPAWCEVKVVIEIPHMQIKLDALMVAGLMGYSAFSSKAGTELKDETADTVQPYPAWWFVLTDPSPA